MSVSIIGGGSLVNHSNFDYRTYHLSSFNETDSNWYAP